MPKGSAAERLANIRALGAKAPITDLNYADRFVSMPDAVAARGMRVLGNPFGKDSRVISGESGAAAFGAAVEILTNPEHARLKEKLHLNENSRVLCFSTEGDTDRENYRRIVWDMVS